MRKRYAGTHLGRQELEGELIEDREDALWSRDCIENAFLGEVPELRRIVVAVDPPASSRVTSDACGIVAAGMDDAGRAIVLADATLRAAKPQDWAGAAVALFHRLQADCIVAEVNQGGDMVTAVIRTVDPSVPVRAVRARRGKWLRAERWRHSTSKARCFMLVALPNWKTRCATSDRTASQTTGRRIGSTPLSGQSRN